MRIYRKLSRKTSIPKQLLLLLSMLLFIPDNAYSQTPTHYPSGNHQVEWTPVNIFVFIVVPILLAVIYILWRRSRRKKKNDEEEKRSG